MEVRSNSEILPQAERSESHASLGVVALSKMIERCCADGNFQDALEFARLGVIREQGAPPNHPGVLKSIANFVRVSVSAGMAEHVPAEYIERLKTAVVLPHVEPTNTMFRLAAIVEYYGALPHIDARAPEFESLQRLHSHMHASRANPDIESLAAKIGLDSCLNLLRTEEYRVPVFETFDALAIRLAVHSPSSACYYRGFGNWLVERFNIAETFLDQAIELIDADVAENRSDEIMKSAILEMRMRVDFNSGKWEKAEQRAFELINRTHTLGHHEEIARRCHYFLAEMYFNTNRAELAEVLLKENNLPRHSGEVKANAHRFARIVRDYKES